MTPSNIKSSHCSKIGTTVKLEGISPTTKLKLRTVTQPAELSARTHISSPELGYESGLIIILVGGCASASA